VADWGPGAAEDHRPGEPAGAAPAGA
jgi:hypothetical protein